MSAGQRESVTVSFTHISEDVIVPSDNIGESKFIRNSIITIGFVLLLVWLFASQPWQTISLWDILSAGFFLFIFLLSVLVLTKQEWYEVDRKLGRINRWSNKRKNKELPPMQPSGLTCKAIKQISGGKTGMSYYHIWAVDDKENAVDLFILPYKTPEATANALAQSVENFLKNFLGGKDISSEQKNFVFRSP